MARSKFPVEILSPEGKVFEGEVEMISTRTAAGSIGILANHTPLLAMLDPTELRLYESENEIIRFAQGEGYLQMTENHALLLVEEAHSPDELDRSELEEKLKRAEQELSDAEDGSEQERVAERDKRRWEAFLKVGDAG